jgi:hypothetical protein
MPTIDYSSPSSPEPQTPQDLRASWLKSSRRVCYGLMLAVAGVAFAFIWVGDVRSYLMMEFLAVLFVLGMTSIMGSSVGAIFAFQDTSSRSAWTALTWWLVTLAITLLPFAAMLVLN